MKKFVLGLGATALMVSVAFAQEPADTSRTAAVDSAAFTKLDSDADGRVSAIEAANDSKVAAGFTQADIDKDGYLSKAEFANLGKSSSKDDSSGATPAPRSDSTIPDSSTTPQQ